jgi:drug/metabolite transporter (DMT)-like permease
MVNDFDPLLVSAIKAAPTFLFASAAVGIALSQGRWQRPSRRVVAALVGAGAFAQLGGNGCFQWSLGIIGLALAVPLCSGTMIISSAILGRILLGEGVTMRTATAILVLVVAIAVLSLGAGPSEEAVVSSARRAPDAWLVATGVALACFSGVAYTTLNVVIRRVAKGAVPVSTMLLIVSATGVVCLGAGSLFNSGWSGIRATPADALRTMACAGVINAGAFYSLSRALQLVSVVEVNIISASQAALAAIAGCVLFREPVTATLVAGVLLTIVGILLVDRRRAAETIRE